MVKRADGGGKGTGEFKHNGISKRSRSGPEGGMQQEVL